MTKLEKRWARTFGNWRWYVALPAAMALLVGYVIVAVCEPVLYWARPDLRK